MNGADGPVVPASPRRTGSGVPSKLRPAAPADTPALIGLGIATEPFPPDEVDPLREMLDDFHAGRLGGEHRVEVWADDPAGGPVGVAYVAPNAMTDRTWDLLWIAVGPDRQGEGIGGELVRSTEAHVRGSGGRLLIVETSSLPRFGATHAFYGKHGYAEVARVADFYADGESKVIFAKRMAPEVGGSG